MVETKKRKIWKLSFIAVALALILGAATVLWSGTDIYAAEQSQQDREAGIQFAPGQETEEALQTKLEEIAGDDADGSGSRGKLSPLGVGAETLAASDDAGSISLTPNNSNGNLIVTGKLNDSSDTFMKLGVVDTSFNLITTYPISGSSFTQVVPMSQFSIGAYYIVAQTSGGRTYFDVALTQIYDTPSNKKSLYETYSKYLFFTPATTHYRSDYSSGVYLDIKAKSAKKWKSYGPISSTTTIKGLKPNKQYQVRVYYGKTVSYNGKNYFFSGKSNKKYKTITIKTGRTKLPVKSVSVRAVNVSKYTHKRYGQYTGLYLGKETWYTYRIKVTVNMKKRPGVKGIYINGKKVKGNKKTYTTKFAKVSSIMYGKHVYKKYGKKWWRQDDTYKVPRGTKYKVILYSYSNKTYKAYSPMMTKKVSIR